MNVSAPALAALVLLAAPSAHARIDVVSPRSGTHVALDDTILIVGTAEASSGVSRVDVALRDLDSGRWLRRDGTWGARQFHATTLLDGGGETADWSFAFRAPGLGRYRVLARGRDDLGGSLEARARSTFRLVPPPTPPTVDGESGEVVAFCPASHRLQHDPIVFPGRPGESHLHSFFGSTATDAFSTLAVLLEGETTCDPADDRSAYWVPTLLENGVPIEPEQATFYYATANEVPGALRAFPPGLRMLAGNPARTGPGDGPSRYKWSCRGSATSSTGDFAVCEPGHELELLLDFPDCWNGRDLDSADHTSHLAYSAGGTCPASHALAVPRLQFKLRWPTSGGPGVSLAGGSGEHAHHGGRGWTAHGDFVNAWLPGTLEARVERCLRRGVKCGTDGMPIE
jgi:hypothetical protein